MPDSGIFGWHVYVDVKISSDDEWFLQIIVDLRKEGNSFREVEIVTGCFSEYGGRQMTRIRKKKSLFQRQTSRSIQNMKVLQMNCTWWYSCREIVMQYLHPDVEQSLFDQGVCSQLVYIQLERHYLQVNQVSVIQYLILKIHIQIISNIYKYSLESKE